MLKNAIPIDLAPLDACLSTQESCILAVIVGVEGPSYRPVGAMMAIFENGESTGSLSSGCIEGDIKLHARDCLKSGSATVVRYGRGSPYLDIVLPCGGGLQILLIPNPRQDTIRQILQTVVSDRRSCTLEIQTGSGDMVLSANANCGLFGSIFRTMIVPELRFLVFGKGPESIVLAALTQSTGFETTLLSPDKATLEAAQELSCKTVELTKPEVPNFLGVDTRTAIVLFFHDHDWELPILRDALMTPAFYIGAQGSQRARDNRLAALGELGVAASNFARLHGPIGLINSARDPRTLAISVLGEIISQGNIAQRSVSENLAEAGGVGI